MTKTGNGWCPDSVKMGRIGERPLWVLYLSIGIRAVHQLGAAVFLSSFILLAGDTPPTFYLLLALVSGLALLASEAMRHRQFYREISGLCTIAKLLLLGAAYHGFLPLTSTIVIAFLIASLGSHLPKLLRHRLLF